MLKRTTLSVATTASNQMIKLTDEVLDFARTCGVTEGILVVLTTHTTAGIIVNEGLPCVETDIQDLLALLVPEDRPYAHAHFLPSYGATGNNSPGHLKSTLVGNNCIFPIQEGALLRGSAQEIYLAEFDGPQKRQVVLTAMGE